MRMFHPYKKWCLVFSLLFIFFSSVLAQPDPLAPKSFLKKRFIFSAGLGSHFNENFNAHSLNLSPRLNIINKYADLSFAVEMPGSIGINPKNDAIFANIPFVAEFYLGQLATKDFYDPFGFSIGGGYGMYLAEGKLFSGAVFTGALRTWLFHVPFTFRYLLTLDDQNFSHSLHSIGISVPLGRWVIRNRDLNKVSGFMKPYRKKFSTAPKK